MPRLRDTQGTWLTADPFCLRGRANSDHQICPADVDSAVRFANPPHRSMDKPDASQSVLFFEAVLDVGHCRGRHEQRPAYLQKRWWLDRLYKAPEVSRVVSQVAIPAAAWPCLEIHRHRFLRGRVHRPHLLQNCL